MRKRTWNRKDVREWANLHFPEGDVEVAVAIFSHETELSDGFGYYGDPVKVVKKIIKEIKQSSMKNA